MYSYTRTFTSNFSTIRSINLRHHWTLSIELREKLPDFLNGPTVCPAIASRVIRQGDMVSVECHECDRVSFVTRILGLGALPAVPGRFRCVLALASVAAEHVIPELLAHGQVEHAITNTMLAVKCLRPVSLEPTPRSSNSFRKTKRHIQAKKGVKRGKHLQPAQSRHYTRSTTLHSKPQQP